MYGKFVDEEGSEYGSFEVFHSSEYPDAALEEGWYWWPCFPGRLPDSEPVGPFETAEEAVADAREEG